MADALVHEIPYWQWQCSVPCACHFGGYCTYQQDMLNASEPVPSGALKVIDYGDPVVAHRMANGVMNTGHDVILANIASSIRRGHPQMRTGPVRPERVCLVGSGPSLNQTVDELRQLVWEGAVLVTMNGGYLWAIEHGFQPQTQIVMDARPWNTRFLNPPVPKCNYVLASQCAPQLWDTVAGRPHVWIFHAVVKGEEDATPLLDDYYLGNWIGVGGGTTVATRSLNLLRMVGYVRFDLFGVDCCWSETHHAIDQPENDRDPCVRVRYGITGVEESQREFRASPWMIKQLEDFLVVMRVNGQHFRLNVHGDGLLAYAMRTLGDERYQLTQE